LATGLDPERYRPIVVLPERGELGADLQAAGVELLVRPLSVLRRALMTPSGLARLMTLAARDAVALRSLIRQRGLSLVHSNTSVVLSGAVGAGAAGVPHIWHVREIYDRFGRAWPVYRRVLGSAAVLPCVSEATAAQFGAHSHARVISDGLAVNPRRTPQPAAREALGLTDQGPVIAVLGRISDWKGQDVLVRALAAPELRERGVVGLLAGEAWPGAEERLAKILTLSDRLGVRDRLRILGFREDLDNVLGAADVIAVPSTAPDPLPNSALEAAAAGCAVIASASGGLPEIIRDRVTGRLVAPGDSGALARVARELIDDVRQRERLGTAAADDVRLRFAPQRLLSSVQDLYDAVLQGRGA
jgi:glycosyltransferase involved in cell wall biosynthesis